MWSEEYKDCLNYIDSYWSQIVFKPTKMKLRFRPFTWPHDYLLKEKNAHAIEIPNYFFVPNHKKFRYIFYWDSFFMFRGLMETKRSWLMKEMVENFLYLFKKFQIIPNFNAPASMGRSQPPFLTSMILDVYNELHTKPSWIRQNPLQKASNKKWLQLAMEVAKKEYQAVWIDLDRYYNHHVSGFTLSRFGDRDIGYALSSELESGWDMTSRFFNRCDQFLPIDLNSYLYKYETDFQYVATLLGNMAEAEKWQEKAAIRLEQINTYMWNEKTGFFYDYGYAYARQSNFLALSGFTPMWSGLASKKQAQKMVKMLPMFETPYGLTITAKESLAHKVDISKIQKRYHAAINEIIMPKQWDYPNIWSPIEYLTVIGLLKYGFVKEAKRIMSASVKAHANAFRKHNTFFEKINGETGEPSDNFKYDNQPGFGWTNAAFYRYVQILNHIDSGGNLYIDAKNNEAPFDLAIPH